MQQCPDRRGRLVTSVPQVDHSVVQKAGKWHLEAKRLPDIRHLYLLVYVASGVCCANLADVNIVNPNRSTDWDDTAIAISLNEKRKFLRIGRQPEGALILLPLLRRHHGAESGHDALSASSAVHRSLPALDEQVQPSLRSLR